VLRVRVLSTILRATAVVCPPETVVTVTITRTALRRSSRRRALSEM
jgi:hypothetical protein